MDWKVVVAGVLIAGSVAVEASAFPEGTFGPPTSGGGPQGGALETTLTALPAGLILPPHLAGGFTGPGDTQALPTMRDLGSVYPAYPAPAPKRHRSSH